MSLGDDWLGLIFSVGCLPVENTSAMERLVRRLRSGEPIPPAAARQLAELIDGREGVYVNRLTLKPKGRAIQKDREMAKSISTVLRILDLSQRMTLSKAVGEVSTELGVNERTVWRCWEAYRSKLGIRDNPEDEADGGDITDFGH